jgi:hypothetical protein
VFVGLPSIFWGVIAWYPLPIFIWKVGLVVMAVMLHKRMRRYVEGDPRIRLRYRFGTGWLTLIFVVWGFLGTLLFLGLAMASGTHQ